MLIIEDGSNVIISEDIDNSKILEIAELTSCESELDWIDEDGIVVNGTELLEDELGRIMDED